MGVYIKGMKMPKNCNECPLHFYEGQGICCCRALPAIDDGEILKPWKNKRKDCPLIPIPPHGNLFEKHDVFKLITAFPEVDKLLPVEFMEALYNLPTIIPAEEE